MTKKDFDINLKDIFHKILDKYGWLKRESHLEFLQSNLLSLLKKEKLVILKRI